MAIRVHRQNAEVAVTEAAQTDLSIRLVRIGIEVLGGEPSVITPVVLPANLEIFLHNWTQTVNISTLWSTDINSAHSSISEERRGLLSKPQRTIGVQLAPISAEELNKLVPALKQLADTQSAVPLFSDQSVLTQSIGGTPSSTIFCDTTDRRFYPDAFCVIVELDAGGHSTGIFHIRTIVDRFTDRIIVNTGIQDITKGRAVVIPLFNTEVLLEPKLFYTTNLVAVANLTLQEVFGPNSLSPLESGLPGNFAVFKDQPIWNFEPDWTNGINVSFLREGSQRKQGRWQITDKRGARARYRITYPLLFERTDTFKFLRFFDTRKGRLLPFWHVDQEDIWVIASQSNGNTEVNITAIGDFTLFEAELDETEPGHLGIVMNDGTIHIEEVTGIDDETTTWEVTLANALPSLDLTQVRRVARARLCRFEKDSNTEQWTTTNVCNMTVPIIELLEEKEVIL